MILIDGKETARAIREELREEISAACGKGRRAPGLAVILVFIGIKMLIVDFYHIPIAVSLGVVFGILVMTFIINAWVNYRHDKQRVE